MASVRPGGENRYSDRGKRERQKRERNRNRGGTSSDNNNRRNTGSGTIYSNRNPGSGSGGGSGGGSGSDRRNDRRSEARRRTANAYGTGDPRRDSGYGFDIDEEIAGPPDPQAADRFDVWAGNILGREGPPERSEIDTLSEGLDAHERYQAGQFVSTLAGAINPVAGLGVKAAEEIYSRQQSPEYQAARDVSKGSSPLTENLGFVGKALGFVSPGLSAASQFLSPGAKVVEADRGLFDEIRTFTGRDKAKNAFGVGGESDDRDTTIRPPVPYGAGVGGAGTMASAFQAPSDFNYSTFLNKFTAG